MVTVKIYIIFGLFESYTANVVPSCEYANIGIFIVDDTAGKYACVPVDDPIDAVIVKVGVPLGMPFEVIYI